MTEETAKRALDLFKRDQEHWNSIYEKAREDLHFLSDDDYAQWNKEDYDARIQSGRPALTVDQLSQFVHQVSNDIRQNTPTLTVIPDGEEGSVKTADIFKGCIRNIEYVSNADDVYDTAANNAVKCSIGFIRVDHDYCDDEGFDQELLIKRVINPLSVFLDSTSIECDGRDAMHGHILDKMKVSEFKKRWPDKEVASFDPSSADKKSSYKDEDEIQIADFYEVLEEEKTIAADDNGQIIREVEEGAPFKTVRKIKSRKVMRYKLSGKEVLEKTTFPGKYIPIIPVYGEEAWIEGNRHLFSLIRKSKSAQMMYNVWRSLETEIIMKQPQAPIMAAEGQIDPYAADWKDPSKAMALRYKTTDAEGNPIPPPQRLQPPTLPSGIVNAARETVDDIKATMGLYNASIGQRSNETSGVAINQRKEEGDVATFHFYDNLVRSITQVYRILISAIPEIYDTPRLIRIVGEEEEPKMVGINGKMVPDQEEIYDLTRGKYTVRVVPGASYTTKRQEAAQFFTEIVKQQPELMQVMGDLLFKNMDFAGASAMAERMKKVIDPKFLDEEDKAEIETVDPEKEQMKQIIEQGAQELERVAQEKEQADAQSELQKILDQIKQASASLKAQEQIGKLTLENMAKDMEIQKLKAQADLKAQHEAQEQADEAELMEAAGSVLAPQEITQQA